MYKKLIAIIIPLLGSSPCWSHEDMWVIIWASGKYGSEETGIGTHLEKWLFNNKAECDSFLIEHFVSNGDWTAERAEFGNNLMVSLKNPMRDLSDFTVYTCDNLAAK